jgi:hypothetical protein
MLLHDEAAAKKTKKKKHMKRGSIETDDRVLSRIGPFHGALVRSTCRLPVRSPMAYDKD